MVNKKQKNEDKYKNMKYEDFIDKHLDIVDLKDGLYDAMEKYSAQVIKYRSLIDAKDGLKPVARRILYTFHDENITAKSKHVKVNKLSGLTMGNWHPHGNMAIDGATVVLARDWEKPLPLVDIHGNKGGLDGSGAASSRYIEARPTQFSELLIKDLNKDAVDFVPNYDDTRTEPKYLPASYPNAIINNSSGIAIGMASNILPHNPLEVLDATIALIKNEQTNIKNYIKGPDFPTSGVIIGKDSIDDEIENGKAKYIIRGKCELHDDKKEPHISITELPYGITTEKLLESLALALEKHPVGALRIDDNSRGMNIDIEIIFKQGTTLDRLKQIENLLYKYSKLQQSISVNNLMIVDGHPIVMGIKSYLNYFIKYRKETLIRIFNFDLNKSNKRLEIVNGLIKLQDVIDEVVHLAKSSQNKDNLIEILQSDLNFTRLQSETIANIPIYKLGKQDVKKLRDEEFSLNATINKLEKLISKDDVLSEYIINELNDIKKICSDKKRKTQLIEESEITEEVKEIRVEELIEEKDTFVVIKSDGIIQRMTQRVYNNAIDDYKDKNKIVAAIPTKTNSYVMAITRNGLVVTRLVNDLPEANLKIDVPSLYKEIPEFKSNDEFISGFTYNANDNEDDHLMVMISKHGLGKVVSAKKLMPNVKTKRYLSLAPKAHGLKVKGDELIYAKEYKRSDLQIENAKLNLVFIKENGKDRVLPLMLKKLMKRNDTGTSSGTKVLNTRPDQWTFKEIKDE